MMTTQTDGMTTQERRARELARHLAEAFELAQLLDMHGYAKIYSDHEIFVLRRLVDGGFK